MTGISKFLLFANAGRSLITRQLPKSQLFSSACLKSNAKNSQLLQQVRGSHGRVLYVRPGMFYTKKFWDITHFYIFIAAIPIGLFILYENIAVGPAELVDIPENYEPRFWEYNKHPIKRIFEKYYYGPPEKAHEIFLHLTYQEQCAYRMRMLENKVKRLIHERQNYRSWYFIPVDKAPLDYGDQFLKQTELKGYQNKIGDK